MVPLAVVAVIVGLVLALATYGIALFKLLRLAKSFGPLADAMQWFVTASVVMMITFAGAGTWAYLEAHKAESSLCVLRQNREDQIAQSESFLKTNPEGIKLGKKLYTAKEIEEGIEKEEATIEALDNLRC